MASNASVVTEVTGQAWIREADGSLKLLEQGMQIPADADIVTGNGASVQLQASGQPPFAIGENRDVKISAELAQSDVDAFDSAAPDVADTDTARIIAALDSGEDPFDDLDPTAAVLQGGSADAGGSSFTRLLSVVELTTPLALEYPRPNWPGMEEIRLGGTGRANQAPELTADAAQLLDQLSDDSDVIEGLNVGQYFSDPDGHPLTFSAIGLPPGLTINPNTGVISGTLDSSASQGGPGGDGIYNVIITATDPYGANVSLPFTWTALNPPPVADDDFATTEENTIVTGNVLTGDPDTGEGQDVDPDGDTLTVIEITNTDGDTVPAGTPISGVNENGEKGGGTFTINPDGSFSFDPGTDFDYLAVGESTTTVVTYKISDGDGGFDEATLTITVTGTNDVPEILVEGTDDAALIVEIKDGQEGENEITHEKEGTIAFADADDSDTHTVRVEEQGEGFLGTLAVGQIDPDTRTLTWTFKVADEDIDHLAEGQTVVQEYVVAIDDGAGGVVTQTVTITIEGRNDTPVITSDDDQHVGMVTEDAIETTTSGQLSYQDDDNDIYDSQTWALVNEDGSLSGRVEGIYGYLELNAEGQWTYTLDNDRAATNALQEGEEVTETFTARITDLPGTFDEQQIVITIVGNTEGEPSIVPDDHNDSGDVNGHITVHEAGLVEEDASHIAQGTIKVSADDGLASITVAGQTFSLDELLQLSSESPSGEIDVGHGKIVLTGFIEDAVVGGITTEGTLSYTYELTGNREHGAPDSDTDTSENLSVELSVTSVAGATQPGVTRTGELIIEVVDDAPKAEDDVNSITEDADIDEVSGNVIDGDGEKGADRVGADGATVVGVHTGDLDDGTDVPESGVVSVKGQFGTLFISADGGYIYQLDNDNKDVNALKDGKTLEDVFTYILRDGDGDEATAGLTITIHGNTDGVPSIVPDDKNDPGSADGHITVHEKGLVEEGDDSHVASGSITITAGDGLVSIEIGGQSYTLDTLTALSDEPAFIELGHGTIKLTGFHPGDLVGGVPTSGVLDYTYTLSGEQTHSQDAGHDEARNFEVPLSVTDAGDDTQKGTLVIQVKDDAPEARDDEATVSAGKLVLDDPDNANVMSNDREGADGASVTKVSVTLDGGTVSTVDVPEVGKATLVGQYGTLTIESDGTYSYQRDLTKPGGGNSDVFVYTLTDGDADVDTATLTISIANADVEISGLTPAADGGDAILHEKHLEAGTSPDSDQLTQSGDFTISAPDGIASLTIGGTEIIKNGVFLGVDSENTISIVGDHGTLKITGYDAETGKVSYEYELSKSQDHDQTADQDETLFDGFEVILIDTDGDKTDGTLSVAIIDDEPTVTVDTDKLESATVSESELTVPASAEFAQIFTIQEGADGLKSTEYRLELGDASTGLFDTLTNDEVKLSVDADGNVLGHSNGGHVLTISIDADGKVTLTQHRAVRHEDADVHDDTVSMNAGAVLVTVSVTDNDGDTDTASVNAGGAFVFQDAGPRISLKEVDLSQVQALLTKDENTKGSESDIDSVSFAGIFAIDSKDAGADGQQGDITWNYALSIANDGQSGLKSGGTLITLSLVDGVVVGKADDLLVFEVSVDAGGEITLKQHAPIDHDDPESHGEIAKLDAKSITLTATATITDGDGDTASDSQTADIGHLMTFQDDGPSIGDPASASVYEQHLDSGSADTDTGKTTVTGALNVDFGADASTARDTRFTEETLSRLKALGITAGDTELVYTLSDDNHVLTASAGDKAIFTATITDPSGTPGYEFDLQGAIDHPIDADGNTVTEQLLDIPFTVIDADGDTVGGSLKINVKDDAGRGDTHQLKLDEDTSITFNTSADGTDANIVIGDGAATDQPQFGTVTVHEDGSITYTPNHNFSGEDRFTYTTIENGVKTTTEVTVVVNPVADKPLFQRETDENEDVIPVVTNEDEAIALGLKAPEVTDSHDWSGNLDDFDNPERLGEITLSGFPEGVVLQLDGQPVGIQPDANGEIRIKLIGKDAPEHISNIDEENLLELTVEQFESLQVLPAPESNKNFTITAKVTSYEVDNAGEPLEGVPGAPTSTDVHVTVKAVTDPIKLEFEAEGELAKSGILNAMEDEPFNLKEFLKVSYPEDYEVVPGEDATRPGDGNGDPDIDGSEERWFEISGLPAGTTIEGGTVISTADDGTITIKVPAPGLSKSATDLPDIFLTAPKDYSGTLSDITVTLVAVDRDKDGAGEDGRREESSIDLTLHVMPVGGDVEAPDVTTKEDSPVYFMAGLVVTDTDVEPVASSPELGEHITAITIKGIPEGWELHDARDPENIVRIDLGELTADGTYEFIVPHEIVDAEEWSGYTLTPPAHSSKDATITLEVTTVDTTIVNGQKVSSEPATKDLSVEITVTPVAEVIGNDGNTTDTDQDGVADLTMTEGTTYGSDVRGAEDKWFSLNVEGFDLATGWSNQDAASDGGSEETFALLSPKWLDMSQGSEGVWTDAIGARFSYTLDGKTFESVYTGEPGVQIPVAALGTVKFMAPEHVAGKFQIKVQAHTIDYGDDDHDTPVSATSGEAWLKGIEIAPVVDPVSLTTTGARGLEDDFIALSIKPHSADPSETFNVKIEDIPNGATVAYGVGTDRLEVLMSTGEDGAMNLTVKRGNDVLTGEDAQTAMDSLGLNVEAGADGKFVLTIKGYSTSGNPYIKPPQDSNVDFVLKVGAQTVDATPELGDDVVEESEWATQNVSVRVKGVADDADVVLKKGADDAPVSFTEAEVEADGISVSSLVEKIVSTDIDGSETVSARLTGLPEGFLVEGASLYTRGEAGAREWLIPINDDGSIPDSVKIIAPEHYSGELVFQLVPVTTENDGDSNTGAVVDVTVHVIPTPEATVSTESTIEEDAGGLVDFSLNQPEGENEALTAIWVKASDISDQGFVLTIGQDPARTLAELADDDSVANVVRDGDFIKITGDDMHNIHAKPAANFADNLPGQGKLSFGFKAEITDYCNDGKTEPVIEPVSGVIEGTHTLNVTPITDEVKVELDQAPSEVSVSQDKVALDIVLSKNPDEQADGQRDIDGSEQFVQLVVSAPDGLLLEGMTVGEVTFENVSYLGNGQWVLHIPDDAYPIFLAGDSNTDGEVKATLNFAPTDFLGAQDHTVAITVVTRDAGADTTKSDTIDWTFTSTAGTGGGALSTIEDITYTSKDYIATEDIDFTLADVFNLTVGVNQGSDSAHDVHFSLVLDNFPEGALLSADDDAGVSIHKIAGEDGTERWVITGKISGETDADKNDALSNVLNGITVTPPPNWNDHADDSDGLPFDVTFAAYLDNGSQKSIEPDVTPVPVSPITDEGVITVSFGALDEEGNSIKDADGTPVHAQEGKPILISLEVTSPHDHGGLILGDTVYFTLDTDGFEGKGKLTTRNGDTIERVTATADNALGDMVVGEEYYVISASEGTLNMPVELVYTPHKDDLYNGGESGGTLQVQAWVKHQEAGASNWKVATGDSQAVSIDTVNNGYKFEGVGETVVVDGKVVAKGDENQDGTGKTLLNITGSLVDGDGSEVVHNAILKGLPVGFLVFVGDEMASNTGTSGDGKSNTWSIPLDADGKLPANISILPPLNWSGTLDGLTLSVLSGEKTGVDAVVETTLDITLEVTPKADGIETLQPALAFGREGEIVELRLNLTMKDNQPADVPGADDQSRETVSLRLEGLGTHAAFYIRDADGNQVLVSEDQIVREDDGSYILSGLTQDDANSLGVVQARAGLDGADNVINVEAWTVDGDDSSAHTEKLQFKLVVQGQQATSGDDDLLFDGTSLLDGGSGDDTVWLRFDEDIDFTAMRDEHDGDILLRNIETLDLTREGFDHELTNLSIDDVLDMTDSRNILTIKADDGDVINLLDGWERSEELSVKASEGQPGKDVYVGASENGSAELHIEADPAILRQVAESLKTDPNG